MRSFVATATVYVRDMVNLLNYLLRVLIFVTPVIYPVSALTPGCAPFLSINPLFPLFSAYQTIILGGVPTAGQVLADRRLGRLPPLPRLPGVRVS